MHAETVSQLRTLAKQATLAADHLENSASRDAAAVGGFNWKGLLALLVQLAPAILSLFTGPAPAPPA